jgi:hypothetical protein
MYKMKIFIYALGFIVVASICSCGNPPGYNYSNSQSKPLEFPSNKQENAENKSGNQSVFQSGANVNSSAALPVAALNPAHGVPGHRCELAVGAPLNAPASAPQNQPLVSQPPVQGSAAALPSSAPATPSKSSAGLNPAHGMPGHRCDIAVGASLSTPVPTAATQKQPPVNTQPAVQSPTAMFPTLSQDASKATARLNPAHGQPGHDCKVAVGEPLK